MAWFRIRKPSRLAGLVLGLVLAWGSLASAQTITYVYDGLGRLTGVIDPSQGTALYTYDAVGNVLSIQRYATTAVLIIDFTPGSGPVNTGVTLTGTGFSATPSQNTVTFNGVTATVTSSTATSIVTTVPTGATTGPISVTAPAGSATSSTSFIVSANNGAPTITSFNPVIGVIGTPVTITGTNFDPAPTSDKVQFNTFRLAPVTAATTTSLTTTVPSAVGSGRIKLTTPGGTVTSAADFFLPLPPYVATSVGATGRMTYAGTGNTISIPAGKIGLVVFDATAGQNLVLNLTSITIADSTITISKPDASQFFNQGTVPSTGTRFEFANLPVTGTYTVMVAPSGTNTGSMTLNVGGPDLTVTALTVPTTPVSPNANGTYTFDVTWTVKNNGNIKALIWWTDTIFLSTDNLLDVSDLSLYARSGPGTGLDPGATYTYTRTVTVPNTQASGAFYILVQTDTNNNVLETNEANNVTASATTVTLLGRPDLTPTALGVPGSPVSPNQNGTYTLPLSFTVANQGGSSATPYWNDKVYLSTDTTWDGGDRQILNTAQFSAVAAGGSYSVNGSGTAPAGTAPGDYWVIVVTDVNNVLFEANETNNTRVSATKVTLLPLPDLVPTSITFSGSPVPRNGDGTWTFPVNWTVANQGGGDAQPSWWDRIYVSTDQTWDSGDRQVTVVQRTQVVAANGSYTASSTAIVPSSVAPGDYYVIVWADRDGSTVESNEANNTLASVTRVTLLP
jgi:YD repeat-containing protein